MPDASTSLSLDGLTALVIGGSSGIGETIARGFQAAGARVAIAARTAAKVEAATARFKAADPRAIGYVADVTTEAAIKHLAERALGDLGAVDILVNSQGTSIIKPSLDFSEAEVNQIVTTNLTSVFLASLAFGRAMIARGSGVIINIASLSAHRGWPNACVYGMTKHAVAGMTQTLAAEWAPHGVRVVGISPGFFMTDLNRDKMSPARKARALDRTPMGRFGELGELVGAAVYLASPSAGFVTGTIINVDGGYLAAGI